VRRLQLHELCALWLLKPLSPEVGTWGSYLDGRGERDAKRQTTSLGAPLEQLAVSDAP